MDNQEKKIQLNNELLAQLKEQREEMSAAVVKVEEKVEPKVERKTEQKVEQKAVVEQKGTKRTKESNAAYQEMMSKKLKQ